MVTLDKIYHAAYVLKNVARKTDLIAASNLAEGMDLYLKTENLQVMQDSVIACVESFHMHWGQKLLNAMRALHSLVESGTLKNEE